MVIAASRRISWGTGWHRITRHPPGPSRGPDARSRPTPRLDRGAQGLPGTRPARCPVQHATRTVAGTMADAAGQYAESRGVSSPPIGGRLVRTPRTDRHQAPSDDSEIGRSTCHSFARAGKPTSTGPSAVAGASPSLRFARGDNSLRCARSTTWPEASGAASVALARRPASRVPSGSNIPCATDREGRIARLEAEGPASSESTTTMLRAFAARPSKLRDSSHAPGACEADS